MDTAADARAAWTVDQRQAATLGMKIAAWPVWRRTRSDLANRTGILRDLPVGGQQRDALDHGLRQQNAVERVLMDRRQGIRRDRVLAGDREFGVTVRARA